MDVNKGDNGGTTALGYAATFGQLEVVKYLVSLKDVNGYPIIDVNKTDIMQYFENNAEMQRLIRQCGYLEKPVNTTVNELQRAEAHIENVHAWYDFKCGDINVKALLKIEENIPNPPTRDESFNQFAAYINREIEALSGNQSSASNTNGATKSRDLAFELIPPDFKAKFPNHPNITTVASEKLRAGLKDMCDMPMPADWHTYDDENPNGGDPITVRTIFTQFAYTRELIGAMWTVLHDKSFISSTLPAGATESQIKTQMVHFEQAFVHALLLGQTERGPNHPACPKGRTSKIIHGLLESINHSDFTTRATLIEARMAKKRQNQNNKALLDDDLTPLFEPITEKLLKRAYLSKGKYPKLFESLIQFIPNRPYLRLMDKNNENYAAQFAPRQHIIGFAKDYLYQNFPQGYRRTMPSEADYRLLEADYHPELLHTELSRMLLDAMSLTPNAWGNNDDVVENIFNAILANQPLPLASYNSENLPTTEWVDEYNELAKKLNDKIPSSTTSNNIDIEFQYALLKAITKPVLEQITNKRTRLKHDDVFNNNPTYLNAANGSSSSSDNNGKYKRKRRETTTRRRRDTTDTTQATSTVLTTSTLKGK